MDILELMKKKNALYLLDNWDDVALRFEIAEDRDTIVAYIKPLGGKEKKIAYPDAYDYSLDSKEITKEQYDKL